MKKKAIDRRIEWNWTEIRVSGGLIFEWQVESFRFIEIDFCWVEKAAINGGHVPWTAANQNGRLEVTGQPAANGRLLSREKGKRKKINGSCQKLRAVWMRGHVIRAWANQRLKVARLRPIGSKAKW